MLKALYRATRQDVTASTGDLALALDVSPGTATSLVKRLAERGLVNHTPYLGVELTPIGRQEALRAIRRHRIVERFLADMLGYPWNEADRLAAVFEHELPEEVEERIFVALDRPESCPHGFPIPAPEAMDLPVPPPLYDLDPGQSATVAVPGSTDAAIVEFLDTLGIRPGVEVTVIERHPFDGPLVLRVDGQDRTLGAKVARQVFVQSDQMSQPSNTRSSIKGDRR